MIACAVLTASDMPVIESWAAHSSGDVKYMSQIACWSCYCMDDRNAFVHGNTA